MDEAKIYNVCLQRVKHQILNARQRVSAGRTILESYNTGDIEEIIDILEIYDLVDRSPEGLREKLDDLAYTVSVLVKDRIIFDHDEKGNLGIYVEIREGLTAESSCNESALASAR